MSATDEGGSSPKNEARSREPIDASAFFSDAPPSAEGSLEGKELVRAYWRSRSLALELERKERYWANICEALGEAYAELEKTTRELTEARAALARMNAELEDRVSVQSHEISERAAQIERLNHHLSAKVEARSQELLAFARELGTRSGWIEPGTVWGGRLRIGDPIGEGGSGVVYRATDVTLGGDLAVKVLRRAYDPDATIRFIAEAAAASRVSHPAVVRPLTIDVSEGGLPYIVMDRVDGRSLHAQLVRAGALPAKTVCRLGAVLVDALAAAHGLGLVHRDVKPGNVMLTKLAPGLRVLDFGLSKVLDDTGGRNPMTLAGRLMGTPAYMSPEQIADPAAAGPPADVYSAGVTLFEACANRLPFVGPNSDALTREHLHSVAPDVRTLAPFVLADLARLIAAMLEKDPANRPKASEASARLDEIADSIGAAPAHDEARLLVDSVDQGETT